MIYNDNGLLVTFLQCSFTFINYTMCCIYCRCRPKYTRKTQRYPRVRANWKRTQSENNKHLKLIKVRNTVFLGMTGINFLTDCMYTYVFLFFLFLYD